MKKYLSIIILVFFLFCIDSSADVVEDLQNFEKSLAEWLDSTDKQNQRLSNLENNIESKDKQLAAFSQSIVSMDELLAKLSTQLEKVENTKSVSGVKEVLKSYEGTLNVFKQRFSGMAKDLEDLAVKTAVLERIYQTSQKPLETLMKTIEEQSKVIDSLSKRIDSQGKTMLVMETDFKKQGPSESFTKGIEELNRRIADLESGTVVLKRTGKEVEVGHETRMEKEKVVTHHGVPAEKPEVPTENGPETMGFVDIGKGFFVKNVEFRPFGSSSYVTGEILNKSGRDYSIADFKVQVYDNADILLGKHGFSIMGSRKNSTKTFEEVVVGISPDDISKYAIILAEKLSFSATDKEKIKIISRKTEVAKVKAKEEMPEVLDLEELIHDEGEKETPKELEGFEDVGNGFYAGKVSFTSFGSSSTVKGEIKNNSGKNYYSASFIMKVYSENHGIITDFDFSVRRLKSGEVRPFEEIIAGVRPVDISRYEIVFKKSY